MVKIFHSLGVQLSDLWSTFLQFHRFAFKLNQHNDLGLAEFPFNKLKIVKGDA